MIIVFEKKSNKIIGYAPSVVDNGKPREFKMEELYPKIDHAAHDFIYVDDSEEARFHVGNPDFKLGKKGEPIGLEAASQLRLQISTDALDRDQDGLPELVTDFQRSGNTIFQDKQFSAWVRIQVMDGSRPAGMSVAVQLSTTGGSLQSRYLTTDSAGKAETRIAPGNETVTLSVLATAMNMPPATLVFEVIPITDVPVLNARMKI